MPLPPGMMPSATSGWLKTAAGEAKRMSQLSASSLPPPPTRPSITAIVAFGMRRRRSHIRWNGFSSMAGGAGSVGNRRMASTSKWAMNHSGLAERSTTTRTASSSASVSATWASSRNTGTVIRLIGGWSMTTVATASSTATCTCSTRVTVASA